MEGSELKLTNNQSQKRTPFVKFLIKLDKVILNIENCFSSICFVLMFIVVIYGIVMRYALKLPNPYGQEFSRYMMIAFTTLGISLNVRVKGHLAVDLFTNMLPSRIKTCSNILASVICLLCYGLLSYSSMIFIQKQMIIGQTSAAMLIPMYVIYSVFLIGFILSLIRSGLLFWNDYIAEEKVLSFKSPSVLEGVE